MVKLCGFHNRTRARMQYSYPPPPEIVYAGVSNKEEGS